VVNARRQRVVLISDVDRPCGLVELQLVAEVPSSDRAWMTASDAMVPLASLLPAASWSDLAEQLERCSVTQIPVLGSSGDVLGWAGDRELRLAFLERAHEAPSQGKTET
jgi:hypothetical protein